MDRLMLAWRHGVLNAEAKESRALSGEISFISKDLSRTSTRVACISEAATLRATIRSGTAMSAERSFSYWDKLSQCQC